MHLFKETGVKKTVKLVATAPLFCVPKLCRVSRPYYFIWQNPVNYNFFLKYEEQAFSIKIAQESINMLIFTAVLLQ